MSSHSPLESQRFGLAVHRFRWDDMADFSFEKISAARPDLAIVRIRAEHLHLLSSRLPKNVVPIVADTLVYYAAQPTSARASTQTADGPRIRDARARDAAAIERIVRGAFANYVNHYAANPRLDPLAVREGFVEWALGFLKPDPAVRIWVAETEGEVVSFVAGRGDARTFEIILNATAPEFESRGFYGALLDHVLNEAVGRFDEVEISTQAHNYRVQRVWQRRGFLITRAYNTLHFNLGPK